jgi:peptide-methionine (S)-S-oxide reductase
VAATGSCSNCCATATEPFPPASDGPGARTTTHNSGHAEAVRVTFDLERLSYRDLLEFFFLVHRADLDERIVASGYRSEIFCTSDEQRKVAEQTISDVDASGHWPGKVVTKISDAGRFWEAEAEDQDYFQRYPDGCTPPFRRAGVEAASRESATSAV